MTSAWIDSPSQNAGSMPQPGEGTHSGHSFSSPLSRRAIGPQWKRSILSGFYLERRTLMASTIAFSTRLNRLSFLARKRAAHPPKQFRHSSSWNLSCIRGASGSILHPEMTDRHPSLISGVNPLFFTPLCTERQTHGASGEHPITY